MKRTRTAGSRSHRGFSLVEVVLSLGVVSFAFVGLVGLIPVGLESFSQAVDSTVTTQIAQRVTTVARQAKFTELGALDRQPGLANGGQEVPDFFFDEQGVEVSDPAAIGAQRYVYTAAVKVQAGMAMPGDAAAAATNPNLAVINLQIRRISAPRDARLVSIYIANNGL